MPVIVVGVDDSRGSTAALRWAAAESRLRAASLTAVHVYLRPAAYAGTGIDVAELEPQLAEQAVTRLTDVLGGSAAELDGVDVGRLVRAGNAARELVEVAATADLLVVGTRGAGGFEGLLLGATAEHCARHAPCPVVAVPPDARDSTGRLVVGVDGSAPSRRALAWAVEEAGLRGAAVDLVSVYEPYRAHRPFGAEFMDVASPGWRSRLHGAAEQVAAEAVEAVGPGPGLALERHVEAGHPAKVLARWSETADLVVVGSRGLGGFSALLLGAVSRQVLHHAGCPVVVVR